ncbi:MAG: M56 family metallopeptidase [Verrucomicrobiaceae bacterium]
MISSFIHEAMRLLARYENLALVVSALLGSGAIVCAAFSLASILKKRSAKARGMVWRMALVMLLVLGAWRLMPEVSEPVAVVQWQVPVAPVSIDLPVTVPSEPLVIPKPGVWTRITRLADEHAKSLWLGVGALLLLWRVLAAWAGVMWLWRRSEPATENVQKLGEAIGAPPSLRYRVVEKIASPMLTGWRRPVVWLPVESKAWSDERLMAVLRHEMAHARHADVLWHWLSTFVVCLWWWQPLAWLGRRGLRLESEQAADDAAVLQSGDTQTYARTLVEIAAGMPAKLRHAAGVTMFGGGEVKQRVEALLRANRWRGRIGLGAMVLMAFLGIALAVLVATTFEFTPKKPVFRSLAKLVAGGRMVANGELQWQEQLGDFYGTIIETIESSEMQRRARERVSALYPEFKKKTPEVEIRVAQTKGSAIFTILATGDEPKYTQTFLNALLDEFIAFRAAIREQSQGKVLSTFLQEVVIKHKVMEEKADLLEKFQRSSNFVTLTNEQNDLAKDLSRVRGEMDDLQNKTSELKQLLEQLPPAAEGKSGSSFVTAGFGSEMETLYSKTKAELFVLNSEREFLLKSRSSSHPEVVALDDKISRAKHLLQSTMVQIKEEMQAMIASLERKQQRLAKQMEVKRYDALESGKLLAEHEKLRTEAGVAKDAYQKLFEQAENFQRMANNQSDYVAIQERATTAAEYTESSLFPVWKLWTPKKTASTD